MQIAVYGAPPAALADIPLGAVQVSPRSPGSPALEAMAPASLDQLLLAAPDGVVERRFVLAAGLRALKPGGELLAMAAKTKGGSRLSKELAEFGCPAVEDYKRGWRMCHVVRPAQVDGIEAGLDAGGPRQVAGLGWSQPGVFSWNRVDPGSALLAPHLRNLAGRGADLGCGVGFLAPAVLSSAAVTELWLADIDRRAIEAARRNVEDSRVQFAWTDLLSGETPTGLDFVVMNPPFHDAGTEDKGLGVAFIGKAAEMLKRGGVLRLVANRHLPYEATLAELFRRVSVLGDSAGFKLIEAVK